MWTAGLDSIWIMLEFYGWKCGWSACRPFGWKTQEGFSVVLKCIGLFWISLQVAVHYIKRSQTNNFEHQLNGKVHRDPVFVMNQPLFVAPSPAVDTLLFTPTGLKEDDPVLKWIHSLILF